ncbi:MAG TPA: DUF924 family protein [Terriglobales bacterium]|nr:DUF924 family protein [Terriglobales bacterium]
MVNQRPQAELLELWFADCRDTGKGRNELWFGGGRRFDDELRQRFGELHAEAIRGELDRWADTPHGLLALVLLLDQLSRNLHRGTAAAFAGDAAALRLARAAVERGWDRTMHPFERAFLYLPFEHSESLEDQEQSVRLFTALRDETGGAFDTEEALRYALEHRNAIVRFGRFPHRNACLGRHPTPEEQHYLTTAPRYGQ